MWTCGWQNVQILLLTPFFFSFLFFSLETFPWSRGIFHCVPVWKYINKIFKSCFVFGQYASVTGPPSSCVGSTPDPASSVQSASSPPSSDRPEIHLVVHHRSHYVQSTLTPQSSRPPVWTGDGEGMAPRVTNEGKITPVKEKVVGSLGHPSGPAGRVWSGTVHWWQSWRSRPSCPGQLNGWDSR